MPRVSILFVVATFLSLSSPAVCQIYWGDHSSAGDQTGFIYRANLDGSQPVLQLQKGNQIPTDLAIDPVNREVFWFNVFDRACWKMGLDIPDGKNASSRTDADSVSTGVTGLQSVTIDHVNRWRYHVGTSGVHRVHLDTGEEQHIVTDGDIVTVNGGGIAIVPNIGPIPAVSTWGVVTMFALVVVAGTFVLRRVRVAT